MARLIRNLGITKVWHDLLEKILFEGVESAPRDQKTREIQNMTIEVQWGRENIIVSKVRDLNYKFMVAEWLWITAGLNDVDILAKYNKVMRTFSDDGHILSGAYGPRLMPQIPYVIENLKREDTRQAVATIWTPSPADSKDIPCTISLQWMIRPDVNGVKKLNCTVNMRSSDAWLGIPYDYFTFSQITNWLGMLVKFPVGTITFNLGSSHLYERDFEKALLVLSDETLSTVESPDFYSNKFVSLDKDHLVSILTNPESAYRDESLPWGKYAEILVKPRTEALEVLRELSTY